MSVCGAQTKSGRPCQRPVTHGAHCYAHAPATREAAAESSRQGGRRRHGLTDDTPDERSVARELGTRAVETHQDLVRLTLDLAQAALRGDIDARDASKVGFLLQPLLKSGSLPQQPDADPDDNLSDDEVLEMSAAEALERIDAVNSRRGD